MHSARPRATPVSSCVEAGDQLSSPPTVRTVRLDHIHRVGLVKWRGREWWCRRNVLIWSGEHRAWWRPNAEGYTVGSSQAWIIDFPTAYDYTKRCGSEKKISFCALALQQVKRDQTQRGGPA